MRPGLRWAVEEVVLRLRSTLRNTPSGAILESDSYRDFQPGRVAGGLAAGDPDRQDRVPGPSKTPKTVTIDFGLVDGLIGEGNVQKWEYQVVSSQVETHILGADLDKQGLNGWELVSVFPHAEGIVRYGKVDKKTFVSRVFKRPLAR